MKWLSFVSPYIKVDCPDGPRFILREPEKAFFIVTADWNARIKTIIRAFTMAEAALELEIAKKFKFLVEDLGRNYANLQAHYQAAYLHFVGNPCSQEANDALEKANSEIRHREFKLREIEVKTEELMKLMKLRKEKELTKDYGKGTSSLETILVITGDIEKLVFEFQ